MIHLFSDKSVTRYFAPVFLPPLLCRSTPPETTSAIDHQISVASLDRPAPVTSFNHSPPDTASDQRSPDAYFVHPQTPINPSDEDCLHTFTIQDLITLGIDVQRIREIVIEKIEDEEQQKSILEALAVYCWTSLLKDHITFNAAFNSRERQLEGASVCQEDTRTEVLERISGWAEENTQDHPICWLEGPAGSGKSAVAQTIAKQYADQNRLAFSFFFSRGKADRSDTQRLFPTFAYKLATSSKAFQRPLHDVLANDMSILSSNLETQCEKLIVEPSKGINTASHLIVVDGLDECKDDLVLELVQLLVDTVHHGLQFCFLFTSRPEKHLVTFFNSPSISSKTFFLSLRDFNANDDVCSFLQKHLDEIFHERRDLMRGVPLPWPSQHDLDILVKKSEHLFIYVSTLVKFVGEENCLPQERLQDALQLHKGLDPMYSQILSLAAGYKHFNMVLGTIFFLHKPLSVGHLACLLQLQPHDIRLALHGCHSILMVPDADDEDTIRPYHASLQDFLTNADRSKSQSLPSLDHNVNIVTCCMKVMSLNLEELTSTSPQDHLLYACQYWLHHFALVISSGGSVHQIEAVGGIVVLKFLKDCCLKQRKEWMYGLCTRQSSDSAREQCSNICDGLPVGQIPTPNAIIS